ncbi:MAG: AmmeMemoRadiSam system protein A [Desulfuromonas sp.]
MDEQLNPREQQMLLEIARSAIGQYLAEGELHIVPCEERRLNLKRGCFVSLKLKNQLRGCIGNFQSEQPLYKNVAEMALAAATKDPRFYPLGAQELGQCRLEISVLSALEKISNLDQIEIGRHGIYLEKDFYRGVLLPQVATEHGWDRHSFLDQTCIKAGLPTSAWRDEDTDIYIFSAQVFGEGLPTEADSVV